MTPEEQRALAQKLATSPEYQGASPEKKQAMVNSFRKRYVVSSVSPQPAFMVDPMAAKPNIGQSMSGVLERHGVPDISLASRMFEQLGSFRSAQPAAPGTMNALLEKRGIPPVTPESGAQSALLALMLPEGVKIGKKGFGVIGQEMAGAGREPVLREAIKREATVAERKSAFEARQAERQTAYEQKVRDTLAEHTRTRAEKRAAYEQKYADKKAEFDARQAERQAAYDAKQAETKAQHQEELAAAKRGYGESVSQAERAKIRESVLETRKRSYAELKDRLAQQANDNIVKAEKSERGTLDQRFGDLRQKVGDAEVHVPIGDAIETGREMLMGEPNSLKVFNDIVKRFDTGEKIDIEGGSTPVFRETMPFDEARTHFTALGEARVGDIPWNVQRALEHVQTTFDAGIKRTIDMKLGADGVSTYNTLKGDWADYLRTWRDLKPLNRGGSPFARVIDINRSQLAKGGMPVYRSVQDMLLSKAARERASYLMARKRQFGAEPSIVARLQSADTQLKGLPKSYGRIPAVKRPEFPKYEAPAPPKAESFEAPAIPKSEHYRQPPVPKPEFMELPPLIDPVSIRRQKLLERAARPASWWDILFPPAGLEHAMLKNRKILEWLAKQPRNEYPLP